VVKERSEEKNRRKPETTQKTIQRKSVKIRDILHVREFETNKRKKKAGEEGGQNLVQGGYLGDRSRYLRLCPKSPSRRK